MAALVPSTLPLAGAYAAPYAYPVAQAPVVTKAAPIAVATPQVYAAPVAPAPAIPYAPSSQFQAQDEFGNVNYGYSNINSQKHEIGNVFGGVTGKYSYVDANNELQVVNYIADAAGFRVQATNLPVAPEAPAVPEVKALEAPVFTGVAPEPVEKTAEVKEAEAKFFAEFEEAKNRNKRSVVLPYNAALPYAYGNYGLGYPYAANYAYAAPTVATATYSALEPVVAKTPAATIKTVPVQKTVAVPAPVTYSYAAPTVAAAPIAAAPAVAYAAPAAAGVEGTLETVKLNPGHAVAYRVY